LVVGDRAVGTITSQNTDRDLKKRKIRVLCLGDRTSPYNLVNKANLVHNFF